MNTDTLLELAAEWDGGLACDISTGKGIICAVTDGFCSLAPYDRDELLGRPLSEPPIEGQHSLLPERALRFHDKDMTHAVATKRPPGYGMRADGRSIALIARNERPVEIDSEVFAHKGFAVVLVRASDDTRPLPPVPTPEGA